MRKLQVKRGSAANTPALADGELGLQMDAGKLVVGNAGEILGVTMDRDLDAATAAINNAIAGRSPSNHTHTAAQVGARPDTWVPSKWDVGLGNVDNTADSAKSVNYANSAGTSNNANALGGIGASDFYRSGNKPFVVGTYTGNGKSYSDGGQNVDLGFTPSAVIFFYLRGETGGIALPGNPYGSEKSSCLKIISGGFNTANAYTDAPNQPNSNGCVFHYAAFR